MSTDNPVDEPANVADVPPSPQPPPRRRPRRWRWAVAILMVLIGGGFLASLIAWRTIDHLVTPWVETTATITSSTTGRSGLQDTYQTATITYEIASGETVVSECTSSWVGSVGDTIPVSYSESDPAKVECDPFDWGAMTLVTVLPLAWLLGGLYIMRRERQWLRWER